MRRILVIEDTPSKWDSIQAVICDVLPDARVQHAPDLYEGEQAVSLGGWDLLILDISLEIRTGAGRAGATQDYVGGLKILGRMYYDELEIPTIIITGFDSFPTVRTNGDGLMLGLEDVEREAAKQLGDHLIGSVRHGPEGWQQAFAKLLKEYLGRSE